MESIDTKELITFSQTELQQSEELIEKFGGKRCSADDYYLEVVIGKSYTPDDNIAYRKLKHVECDFEDVSFDGTDGASSIVIDCRIKGCDIKNAGFRTSDFSQTQFLPSAAKPTSITNTSLHNSNFTASLFQQTNIEGCSFIHSMFRNTEFIHCTLCFCDFEDAVFENTTFESIDLTTSGIDFAEFIDVNLQDVTLSCWGILWSFGGLDAVKKFKNEVQLKLPDNDTAIPAEEFLRCLPDLQAHFYFKKDYFSLANINIFLGNQEKAFLYIKEGLLYNLYIKNFRMIKFLCKLASYNHFFTKKQLSQLYYILQSDAIIHKMTSYEYRNYLYEMNDIKKLLVDNPFNLPQIIIKITTDIDNEEQDLLKVLLGNIDQIIKLNAGQSIYSTTIRHNSPTFIEILDSDVLQNLYQLGANLIISFWGLIPQINALLESFTFIKQLCTSDTKLKKKLQAEELEIKKEELKNQKLNNELLLLDKQVKEEELKNQVLHNQLLAMEIEKQRRDMMNSEEKGINGIASDTDQYAFLDENAKISISPNLSKRILKISFSINTSEMIPSTLREFTIQQPD